VGFESRITGISDQCQQSSALNRLRATLGSLLI
jgi:hypothetical protein